MFLLIVVVVVVFNFVVVVVVVVVCNLLTATGITKQVHILHSSEYPKTTFAVLDSMKCLVADNSFDTIFAHLKSFYTPRKAQKIEAKGFYYELRQYVVKFGSIVTGSTNRGIVVEVWWSKQTSSSASVTIKDVFYHDVMFLCFYR